MKCENISTTKQRYFPWKFLISRYDKALNRVKLNYENPRSQVASREIVRDEGRRVKSRLYNTRIFRSIRDCDPLNFKLIDPNRDNRKFDA